MVISSIILLTIYSLLILLFVRGLHRLKPLESVKSTASSNFTIVIPFRDEAENLTFLLESISKINYPLEKFEIVLVNDQSQDESVAVIEKFKLANMMLRLNIVDKVEKSNSPKKDAILTAIEHSKFEWILTTDADCIVPVEWLIIIDQLIQKEHPKMIVAPVSYQTQNTLLSKFQQLDFLSLQGSTMAGFGIGKPFLCNGANLCYYKKSFYEINGFKGNENIASGDDIFMLEKMVQKYPDQVQYLKSNKAIVQTKPEDNISSLLHQRIRWASKTSHYNNAFAKAIGSIIFLTNLYLLVLLGLAFFSVISWQHMGLVFVTKFNLDLLILYPTSMFFKQQDALRSYVVSSLLYPFFCITVVLLSLVTTYEWKGRTYTQ